MLSCSFLALMMQLVTCEDSQLPKSVVEVEDVVVSNFHEGWERKEGVEEGEKRGGNRAAAAGRPIDRGLSTDRQTTSNESEGEEGREERERGSDLGM